jgi:sugar lactone lactonase YvrE
MNLQDDNQNKGSFPRLTSPFVAWGICVSTFFASQAYADLHPAPVSLAAEKTTGQIEPVFAFYEQMPSGVTVSDSGRVFVNFPRWGDKVDFTVGEIVGSELVPYPNSSINDFDPTSPSTTLISVQSVIVDGTNRLWMLDTAAPSFATPIVGGAKLVGVDLATNKVVRTILFPPDVVLRNTYLNDVRFDLRQGKGGIAYITDSGASGIIVVDLASGRSWRRLTGDRSTVPDASFVSFVEGDPLAIRLPGKSPTPWQVASDGLALSADGNILFYAPLSSRHLYKVPTELLRAPSLPESQVSAAVTDLGEKGASDGLEADSEGRVYATDYEHNAIRVRAVDGSWTTLVHDPRVLWPDTLSLAANGYLYFTSNQWERMPMMHGGTDLRKKPYSLFRIKVAALPVRLGK